MGKCITLANIDQALSCADMDNMGGLTPKLIYGYWNDVDVWPTVPAGTELAPIALDAAGVLTGDLVMKAGTSAYQMDFTDETGELKISDQGETGGESYLYDLSIVLAKARKQIFGFENATKGRKMFFIVQDNNGTYYLMGDKRNGAKKVSGDGSTTGTKATDLNKNSLHYTYNALRKLTYAGDVETLLTVVPVTP